MYVERREIMRSDISNGVVMGVAAGVVFGIMMQMMNRRLKAGKCP
jgi:hypothetical protein